MFCTKCGRELRADGSCVCSKRGRRSLKIISRIAKYIISKFYGLTGISDDTKSSDLFESDKLIVPDCIASNQDEIPIKQYNIAKMRSRILGKFAEGRMQVTNKRLIFRASGISSAGRQLIHNEFKIDEIGGIEIRRSSRLSFMNLILAVILSLMFISVGESISSFIGEYTLTTAKVCAVIVFLASVAVFLLIKRKFWLKLMFMASTVGLLAGLTSLEEKALEIIFGFYDFTDAISVITILLFIYNILILSLVPNLEIVVKATGAGDTLQVHRKVWGMFFKNQAEYTDYSEVYPWDETQLAANELGALIHDIQTLGDMAIDKWKEN